MAMAVAALAAASANTTNNAASHTGTAGTPTSGDLLIAVVQVSGNTAVGSMSGQWTWIFLTSFTKNSGADTVYIFYASATAATSTTPVYTISGNSTGSAMSVYRITGLDSQVQPYIRQFKSATGTAANPAVTMDTAILTGNGVIGIATNTTSSATQWTAPGSWSEMHETNYSSPATSLETAYRASGETGTTITWTNANTTAWAVMVIELYVAGTGAVPDSSSAGCYGGNSSI
jgi:hypothetical protein